AGGIGRGGVYSGKSRNAGQSIKDSQRLSGGNAVMQVLAAQHEARPKYVVNLQHFLAIVEDAADRRVEQVRIRGVVAYRKSVEDVFNIWWGDGVEGGNLFSVGVAGPAGMEGEAHIVRKRSGSLT